MRVLHVLANGPPDVNGYAIRTKMTLEHLDKSTNVDVIGLTSPWYPRNEKMMHPFDEKGIRYLRTPHPAQIEGKQTVLLRMARWIEKRHQYHYPKDSKKALEMKLKRQQTGLIGKVIRSPAYFSKILWKVFEEKLLIRYFTKRIIEVAKKHEVDLIHAHTPYRVGLPALRAARKLKIPMIYEMRGMWEETAVANGRWMKNGPAYTRFRKFETKVLRKSDGLICISEALKKEAISRGVREDSITIVPNGISPRLMESTTERPDVTEVQSNLKLNKNTTVVGYIGSLREMEGVDQTAESVADLISKGHDIRFFVLTGKPGQTELKQFCEKLGISENTVITGPVPHDRVPEYYDLIDVFVVSRPDTRVTRFVTPLKPFEAMAMGKCVVASNLPALKEIIRHEETGLLYNPDSHLNLSSEIEKCLSNPELKIQIEQNARNWVLKNRTWADLVQRTVGAYDLAIKGRK